MSRIMYVTITVGILANWGANLYVVFLKDVLIDCVAKLWGKAEKDALLLILESAVRRC